MNNQQIDDLGFCPSFSCYSSNSLASTAASNISSQLQQQQQQSASFHKEADEEYDFSFRLGDDVSSTLDISSYVRTDFPLFNRDLLSQPQVDGDQPVTEKVNEEEAIDCLEYVSSCSESSDSGSPGVFCVWRHRTDAGSISPLSKCKKSSSTGSGSKRWRIRDLLRRSNSEGKEPMVTLLTHKKVENLKQKSNYGDVAGKAKASSIHELLYVQQRAKREGGKRRSYLPYRQGLVGFFTNVNGSGKKL